MRALVSVGVPVLAVGILGMGVANSGIETVYGVQPSKDAVDWAWVSSKLVRVAKI